jgi:hypothetical protein
MTKRHFRAGMAVLGIGALIAGCGDGGNSPTPPPTTPPTFDPNNFVAGVTNPFFPLPPGRILFYQGQSEGTPQTDSAEVLTQTKTILGIAATVVHDRVYSEGSLIEDTFDWYGQDKDGNVWYLGEDTKELDHGTVVSTEGTWEAGVNGAEAGIIMFADPSVHIGVEYRQEFAAGVAEDLGKVVAVDQSVTVPLGTYTGCVKTEDRSALEPGILENKFYCPQTGITSESTFQGGNDKNELAAVIGP